ncbi:Flp pilus assembly protein CpaB [Sphingomonas sp. ABOLD]|uniref:Pilus assembly protein CpaB n=1 Tax=Sphingomonas trueperi TaxID=53317 RepID=A0A7X5XX58_9SPHN|nr:MULTISPECIES: Flp pilus assembly protein CpaB [Sphingomonas]NJB96717.1 pilus assembly protein CpaB [Sphingomonas trueperi]RSV51990.1 Flp pilus assembly protein CpaB [Sphingomonas sp. ABOLD]
MDARRLLLLVGALLVAGITAFMARTLVLGSAAPAAGAMAPGAPAAAAAAPVNTTEVLVAKRALPVGTILDATALEFRPWPKDLVEGAYYVRGQSEPAKLQGAVVRFAVPAGQPVTQGALVKPGDRGFLAAALGPGMRAVTVPVSAQSAVAGFVFPGDHIDLILTQTVSGDGPPLRASETVLRNLRVLATDQRTDKQTDDKGKTVVTAYSTVTVEATPKIAEKIAVAQTVGTLSLSLRSLADTQTDLDEAIASGAVSVPDDPKKEKAFLARATSRPQDDSDSYVTGADVSRFQRRTVPATQGAPSGMAAPAPAMVNSAPVAAQPIGTVVRVVRGSDASLVPVGGKN